MRVITFSVIGVFGFGIGMAASHADEPSKLELSAAFMAKETGGAWWAPLPPKNAKDRMQAVHVALLPSGKVLIVNGSSNRNRFEGGMVRDGIFPLDNASVDNTALFDPKLDRTPNSFQKIGSPPSPLAPDSDPAFPAGRPNDLFCSGHMHLQTGEILFAGGTQNYYPGEKFHGSRTSNIFDWKTERWRQSGLMTDGHWYPALLPLSDGRVMVVSGLSWNRFSNSSWVEFYDPTQPEGTRWTAVDTRTLPNSPFNTPVVQPDPLPLTGAHGKTPSMEGMAGQNQPPQATPNTSLDDLDHYPRIAPLPDGRFLITGDGSGGGNINSQHTYLMTVGPRRAPGQGPSVQFQLGPDRSCLRKTFGTAFLEPTSTPGSYLLVGGLAGSGDINIGPAFPSPQPARINTVGSAERYTFPTSENPLGRWEAFPNFLGDKATDRRIMHVGVLLPTRQVLLMGGGLYGTSLPLFSPILMTPDAKAKSGYTLTTMNPGQQPRLYHTSALLLPDGRVFLAGGNATRATRDVATGEIRLDLVRTPDGDYVSNQPGNNHISSEIYQIEIFYPPYLFIPGERPKLSGVPDEVAYGSVTSIRVENASAGASMTLIKYGTTTHAWDMGQRLASLAFTQSVGAGTADVQFTAPTDRNLYPPGYYMLFYINGQGKPSESARVRLN